MKLLPAASREFLANLIVKHLVDRLFFPSLQVISELGNTSIDIAPANLFILRPVKLRFEQ